MKGERKRITIAIAIERIWDILVGSRGGNTNREETFLFLDKLFILTRKGIHEIGYLV